MKLKKNIKPVYEIHRVPANRYEQEHYNVHEFALGLDGRIHDDIIESYMLLSNAIASFPTARILGNENG